MSVFKLLLLILLNTHSAKATDEIPEIEVPHWNLNPYYSEQGYKLGFINDFGASGRAIKTIEGHMQLGFSSSTTTYVDRNCVSQREREILDMEDPQQRVIAFSQINEYCKRTLSPWAFSSSRDDLMDKLESVKGGPVLVYYYVPKITVVTDTNQIVEKVWGVDQQRKLKAKTLDRKNHFLVSQFLNYEDKNIDGRVVQAAIVGNLRSHYLLTIQIGGSGNNFTQMNVATSDLFDFIVESMAVGCMLRLYYINLYGFTRWPAQLFENYETHLRVYAVDRLQD